MNLGELTLVPFKTKAKRADGVVLTYTGKVNVAHGPFFKFAYVEENDGSGKSNDYRLDGRKRFDFNRSDLAIVSVSKPWRPRVGDTVRIIGAVHGQDSQMFWGNESAPTDVLLLACESADSPNEHFRFTRIISDGSTRDWYVHRRNIRRIR